MIQNPNETTNLQKSIVWYKLWPLYNWPVIYSSLEKERFKTHRLQSLRPLGFISPVLLPTFVILGKLLHPANLQGPSPQGPNLSNGDNSICLLELLWAYTKVTCGECLAYNSRSVSESHHHIRLQGESPKATFTKETVLIEISARPKKQESTCWMMAVMTLRVVQGLMFGDKEPFLVPPALPSSRNFPHHVSQTAAETGRKRVQRRPAWNNPDAPRPWLPAIGKGVACLQSSCQAHSSRSPTPCTLGSESDYASLGYRVT